MPIVLDFLIHLAIAGWGAGTYNQPGSLWKVLFCPSSCYRFLESNKFIITFTSFSSHFSLVSSAPYLFYTWISGLTSLYWRDWTKLVHFHIILVSLQSLVLFIKKKFNPGSGMNSTGQLLELDISRSVIKYFEFPLEIHSDLGHLVPDSLWVQKHWVWTESVSLSRHCKAISSLSV